jgi:glutamate N-acetyltransferase/amino-acid N-acetyltransferase
VAASAGVEFDQNELAVKLGDVQLMQAGQPLAFDAKVASKYLKDTCAKHGTVNIYVTIGKGTGKGKLISLLVVFVAGSFHQM